MFHKRTESENTQWKSEKKEQKEKWRSSNKREREKILFVAVLLCLLVFSRESLNKHGTVKGKRGRKRNKKGRNKEKKERCRQGIQLRIQNNKTSRKKIRNWIQTQTGEEEKEKKKVKTISVGVAEHSPNTQQTNRHKKLPLHFNPTFFSFGCNWKK